MASSLPIIAVTGMAAEARIARGTGVVTLAGGGDPARLAMLLQGALARGAKGVISFGVAGGLAPDLRPGSLLIAEGIVTGDARLPADSGWIARLSQQLPEARRGDLAGVDRVVAGADGKAALRRRTGALAVDMESHIAARLAALHGVGFAALRVVADPAHRTLPEAATVGMRPDGGMDVMAVLGALVRRPGELTGLIRTALEAGAAFAALKGARRRLPGTLAFDALQPALETGRPEQVGTEADDGLFVLGDEGVTESG